MSLSITNNMAGTQFLSPTGLSTQPARQEPDEIKSKILANMDSREQHISSQVASAVDRTTSRLGNVEQYAIDNDYSRLATAANNAAVTATTTGQHVSDQITRHFDITENLLLQRPEGGYSISQETADSLSGKIEQTGQTRLTSLLENSEAMSARLAELAQQADDKGLSGDRIEALGNRLDSHVERRTDFIESRVERALNMVQNRVSESYDIPPDSGLSTEDGGGQTDIFA